MVSVAPALLGAGAAARAVLEARERGETSVTALVLAGSAAGRRMIWTQALPGPVRAVGTLSHPSLERALREEATALLETVHTPLADTGGKDAFTREVEIGGAAGGAPGAAEKAAVPGAAGTAGTPGRETVPVYLEVTRPPAGLLIVGAGHLAEPLHELGIRLGFRVTVVDDRPAFARAERFPQAHAVLRVDFADPFQEIPPVHRTHVLLVTRGHRYDYECLRRLLREDPPPRYLGMIGSRRRVRATFHQLREEGIPRERLEGIRAPVGLDVGAETPEEIAVAVAAEWIQLRRGGTGRPLSEVERVARRFFPQEEG